MKGVPSSTGSESDLVVHNITSPHGPRCIFLEKFGEYNEDIGCISDQTRTVVVSRSPFPDTPPPFPSPSSPTERALGSWSRLCPLIRKYVQEASCFSSRADYVIVLWGKVVIQVSSTFVLTDIMVPYFYCAVVYSLACASGLTESSVEKGAHVVGSVHSLVDVSSIRLNGE